MKSALPSLKDLASWYSLELKHFLAISKLSNSTITFLTKSCLPSAISNVHLDSLEENASKTKSTKAENENHIIVKAPIIGTFYRKPSPDKSNFVEVGSPISEGDVLCVVEAMKLFNEIESEVTGKIVKILIDDSSPVEFDQPLFLVDPS